ncbi:hypothetical protein F4861DRAFT_500148 [Xylaria intraflava]|nr:hypothetical protein F4861DRAFT_500148 [Xylaria intraflava]
MNDKRRDIAIIGSGCRFAGGATSPSKLWSLLRNPRIVASEVPALKGHYHDDHDYHGHTNVKEAYLLEGDGANRDFDAAFFGTKTAEADVLDPQVRLLLETVYETLEEAGLRVDDLRGSDTAVYAGQMTNDYQLLMCRDPENVGKYHATGTSRTMLSNRISYFFDWHGPSMTIDTACSSSLVALHHAVQQLRLGHSRMAIVAGSNLIFDVFDFIAESNLQMLSPNGRSRMWDIDANGYARGEGVAAVVLKVCQTAEADGDHIECIIRETAVNQDGKTRGQTMPSATAQAQLIRDCYARIGLDSTNPKHQPQYFEAHGTGTQAGDPIEAEAINVAFALKGERDAGELANSPMFVGSIKTVVGHTEGTAGLAGILKASLALQNATIPPNILFKRLNPRVAPFYDNLCVPVSLTPWPAVPEGSPRRVSVNSFGFGGTNAHAILENYVPSAPTLRPSTSAISPFIPFVFSAASEASLKSYLTKFYDYLRNSEVCHDLRSIAYTLMARREHLSVSITIGASTVDDLCAKLEEKLEAIRLNPNHTVGIRSMRRTSSAGKPRVLGVFTGQGAQWAQMGLDLIVASTAAKAIIERLQIQLNQLPDKPAWTILEELQKGASSSRLLEPAICQPLCTVIQILQIELLRASSIDFTAVLGHSSGEIAAAYAAGFISAEDAISIAYYRGICSDLSQGSDGQSGSMMAVQTSVEDAQDLLEFPEFRDRASIAAINSENSLTLSGDQEAINLLKVIFEDEGKRATILHVNKAYHSYHMKACSASYLDSLAALDIKVGRGGGPLWLSTVYGSEMCEYDLLRDSYWDINMVKPVLFKQAVDSACASTDFDLIIELGPHPALKGPTLQTTKNRLQYAVPYTGLFYRGASSIVSFADGLGYAWSHLGKGTVNLQNYDQVASGDSSCKLVKGLPTYAWDHENDYWHESRYAKASRMRPDPVHELLGHLTPDSTEQDMRWRHILRPSEIPWLTGHRIQSVIVFPATGYIVSVLEAALLLCNNSTATLIEIIDVDIISALAFEDDNSSIEIVLSLTNISRDADEVIEAEFKYCAASGKGDGPLELKAKGLVRILLGQTSRTALPGRLPRRPNLVPVRETTFYQKMSEHEYYYTGQFKSLERLERKLGAATGLINQIEKTSLLVHPGTLDAAVQSSFLTYADPDDGTHQSIYLPKRIRQLTVNPELCAREGCNQQTLGVDSIHPLAFPHANMVCDIDVYPHNLDHAMIKIQGLELVPLSEKTAKDDREMFANIVWGVAEPDAQEIVDTIGATPVQAELIALRERVASTYLRAINRHIRTDNSSKADAHHNFRHFGSHISHLSEAGDLPISQPHWELDVPQMLPTIIGPYSDSIDIKLLSVAGKDMISLVRTNKPIHNTTHVTLKKEWYAKSSEVATFAQHLSRVLKEIIHRYPHMHILEVRADMDTATEAILQQIGSTFASYTVITPDSDSLNSAPAWMKGHEDKITFKPMSSLKDQGADGLPEAGYDLIVAPLSLYSTEGLDKMLRTLRRLLKPGGYLLALETLPFLSPFFGLVFEWLSAENGQHSRETTSPIEWDSLLRNTGFSGIDTRTPDQQDMVPFFIFVAQAVDEKIAFLRDPLSHPSSIPASEKPVRDLLLLGGDSARTTRLVSELSSILRPYYGNLRTTRSLSDVNEIHIAPNTMIVCLADLDRTVFKELDSVDWEGLKKLMLHAGHLTWITQGRLAENPYANMIQGLLRGAARDNQSLEYLLFDIEDAQRVDSRVIATAVIRNVFATYWRYENILSSVESELVLDEAGRTILPRLILNKDMNDRYNSNSRLLKGPLQIEPGNLGINMTQSGWEVELGPPPRRQEGLRATHSLLSPIRVDELNCMFLVLGEDDLSGNQAVVLSAQNKSFIGVGEGLSVKVGVSTGSEALFLRLTAHYLLASTVLRGLFKDDKILIYGASPEFASIIAEQATLLGVKITFAGSNLDYVRMGGHSTLVINPTTFRQSMPKLAQSRFSAFVNMMDSTDPQSIGARVAHTLPIHCRKEDLRTLFGEVAHTPTASRLGEIHDRFTKAVAWASTTLAKPLRPKWESGLTVTIDSFTQTREQLTPISVIEWSASSRVIGNVRPIEAQISLPGDKTYWLVGLTGQLGLSLCEWMVQRGARYFVISSRNPNLDAGWLNQMREKGVCIKVSACDVCRKEEVEALYNELQSSMPAIAGVAQGAMVLHDTGIEHMTLEQLLRVTKPKVDGSIHLNNLFQEDTLDFFIVFSSASAVVGNYGQANYAAANTFMASLAAQRRRQGLAASVIHIGPVFGVGYITRAVEGSAMGNATIQAGGFARTSERDLHQLFGEALLAGHPRSSHNFELVSGVRTINQQEEHKPVWESWPYMGHFVHSHPEGANPARTASRRDAPIKANLANAENREQVYNIIWDAFIHELRSYFPLDINQVSKAELAATRFDQIGIDSLMAVDIRSWFRKTIEVSVPVLRILNGGTIGELVAAGADTIPPSLIPKFEKHATEESSPASSSINQNTPDSSIIETNGSTIHSHDDTMEEPSLSPGSSTSTNADSEIIRSIPISFTQARFYPSGFLLEHRTGVNHTVWARFKGQIDADRLRSSVRALGQQHEILRTAFFDQDGKQMQHILNNSILDLEHWQIKRQEEMTTLVTTLQKEYIYNLERGETMRIILLSRSTTENFLVIGIHPIVADGSSFQTLCSWLAFHYAQPDSVGPVKQYSEASEQQLADYASGKFETELRYWRKELATLPPPLPLLSLSKVKERPKLKAYDNVRSTCIIKKTTKARISKICRQLRATPFQFYLAVLRALLLRYTVGGEDIIIAIAESGRGHSSDYMDLIGPLYNVVLLRLIGYASDKFEDLLEVVRDKTYRGLSNSRLPYPVLVKELDLQRKAQSGPFFQVFANYRTGQRMTMKWGDENELNFMGYTLNLPYDVYLDTVDDPDGDCIHDFSFREDLFGTAEAEQLARSYERLVRAFAAQPGMIVEEVDMSGLENATNGGY